MNEPIKTPKQKPESYRPGEKPVIISLVEEKDGEKLFAPHESGTFSYRFDYLEISEGLKFVGAVDDGSPLSELDAWNKVDKSLIKGMIEPYAGIRLWQNETHPEGKWTSGVLAYSIDGLPDGAIGIDTGWKRFVVLTVRFHTVDEVYDGNSGHWRFGHSMGGEMMPPEYKKLQYSPPAPGTTRGFCTKNNGSTSIIEIYSAGLRQGVPEMCFYYPLKDQE